MAKVVSKSKIKIMDVGKRISASIELKVTSVFLDGSDGFSILWDIFF